MRVRTAVIEDAYGIATVHVRTWQAAYRGIVPDEILDAMDIERRAERWRDDWLSTPGGGIWVAEEDEAIIGWANAGPSRDSDEAAAQGELYGIYVAPTEWGTGAGRSLLDVATAWLSERYESAALWTLVANARARRFYEKNGWRFDGTTKDDDRGSFVLHEVRYSIDL
jgi:RimJ/RimL family protein N-acetyltransferase